MPCKQVYGTFLPKVDFCHGDYFKKNSNNILTLLLEFLFLSLYPIPKLGTTWLQCYLLKYKESIRPSTKKQLWAQAPVIICKSLLRLFWKCNTSVYHWSILSRIYHMKLCHPWSICLDPSFLDPVTEPLLRILP